MGRTTNKRKGAKNRKKRNDAANKNPDNSTNSTEFSPSATAVKAIISSKTLSSLEDLLLARILVYLPLQRLVPLRRVSRQWRRVIETELFASVLDLKLETNILRIPGGTNAAIREMSTRFDRKRINSRLFYTLMVRTISGEGVHRLIRTWFPNLQKLHLEEHLESTNNLLYCTTAVQRGWQLFLERFDSSYTRFLSEILKKPDKVKQVNILCLIQRWTGPTLSQSTSSASAAVLKHLTHFTIEKHYSSEAYVELLAGCTRLSHLTIKSTKASVASFTRLLSSAPALGNTVTHLILDRDTNGAFGVDLPLLDYLVEHFWQLTHLSVLTDETCKIHVVLKRLAKFPLLSYLKLQSYVGNFFYPRYYAACSPPLTGIRELHVEFSLHTKNLRILGRLFPNLERITLNAKYLDCRCLRKPTDGMFGRAQPQTICRNCGELVPILLRQMNPYLEKVFFENAKAISKDDRAVNKAYMKTEHELNPEYAAAFPMAAIMQPFFRAMQEEMRSNYY